MALVTFSVDPESVRRHHFPFLPAFAAGSRPTSATVTEAIEEEAARMAGALALETIDAASITVGSPAYIACRATLRLAVAARLARDIPGTDSALSQRWREAVDAWYEALDEGGDTFLGEGAVSTAASDPDGPTDFISELSLETGDAADASDVKPVLRRKDDL